MDGMDGIDSIPETKDWQHIVEMTERFKFLVDNMESIPTDVSFAAGPNKIKTTAHKFMLAFGSSVFHSMFFGKMKENVDHIDIPDVDPDVFQALIRYFYTGETPSMTTENVMSIMYCAKKYWVESLSDKCRLFVQENITVDSACEVLYMADLLDEKGMKQLATIFIAREAANVLASSQWASQQENIVVLILQLEDLTANEVEVYEAAKGWVQNASASLESDEEKKQLASRIFQHVRMPLLSPSEIANGPAVDQVLSQSELMDLYAFKFADKKPDVPYNAQPRTPRPDTFFVAFDLHAVIRTDSSAADMLEPDAEGDEDEDQYMTVQLGTVTVEVRADVVPATAKFFFALCDDDMKFSIHYADVEFGRDGSTGSRLGKMKHIPLENNLLRSMPGWVSFKLADDGVNAKAKSIQVHPKGVNEAQVKGVVFGRIVQGFESFENVDGFLDKMWENDGKHPMNEYLPSVNFYVCNVKTMLDGNEEDRVVELDDEDDEVVL